MNENWGIFSFIDWEVASARGLFSYWFSLLLDWGIPLIALRNASASLLRYSWSFSLIVPLILFSYFYSWTFSIERWVITPPQKPSKSRPAISLFSSWQSLVSFCLNNSIRDLFISRLWLLASTSNFLNYSSITETFCSLLLLSCNDDLKFCFIDSIKVLLCLYYCSWVS